VFVFSPIFQNAEQAVHIGLDNAIDDKSTRRSSVSSYIWDDFLPAYKKESDLDDDEEDKDSFTSIETITDFDSRESTPCQSEPINDYKKQSKKTKSKKVEPKFYESNVRKQGDKLLRDMLQLRKDIENFKEHPEENTQINEKSLKDVEVPLLAKGSELEKNEENILRERLEMMTLQIKQELEEELLQEESRKSLSENKPNEDDDTKIKHFFQNLVLHNSDENTEPSIDAGKNSLRTGSVENEALNLAIQNLLEMNDEPKNLQNNFNTNTQEKKRESISKGRSPSVKVETLKRKGKSKKKTEPKQQIVEIPFCSHNQHTTPGQDTAVLPHFKKEATIEKEEPKESMNTILSKDEQLGAEEILRELIEIRDSGKSEKNPVLDTMISIIQLSSTNVSLPSLATSGSGVQFKELFDFEVNFSESREAFAKLAGLGGPGQSGSKKTVTVQELFPWSGAESGTGPYNKLRDNLL